MYIFYFYKISNLKIWNIELQISNVYKNPTPMIGARIELCMYSIILFILGMLIKKKKKNAVKYNRLEGRILRILFRVNSI